MKIGDWVKHSKLGIGKILEFCKYGGLLVDFSNKSGVLVRVVHFSTVIILMNYL